jgi:methylglutamate dehydrogenase subunit D
VANLDLKPRSAFTGWTAIKTPAFSADVREELTLASISAGNGQTSAVAKVLADTIGVTLPTSPIVVHGKNTRVMWVGPDQWIAMAEGSDGRDLERELKGPLSGLAAVADLSDARVVMRISGPKARAVLAKGLPLDLHPSVFKSGDVAISHVSHIGVLIWQVDDAPTYDIAMFRSFADSFAHWLVESAAEFTGPIAH